MADSDLTIVLVHGAFADASSFRSVYDELLGEGVTMIAPPNPLRGMTGGDGEYLKGVIGEIDEIDGASHVVMISHPKEVAKVVMTAARTCAAQPA